MYYTSKIDKFFQYLLISFAFVMPLTVAGGNIIAGIIILFWLISGNYEQKFKKILESRLAIASLIFFGAHVLGILWSQDIIWGLEIIRKMTEFGILLPILLTLTYKRNVNYYIFPFLLAITITALFSYLIYFEILPPFKNATIVDPTPFMSRVSHGPLLAFSSYIALNRAFFYREKNIKFLLIILFLFFSFNVFITEGRAGHLVYFVLMFYALLQKLGVNLRNLVLSSLIITFSASLIYFASSTFNKRVNTTYENVMNFKKDANSSIGYRLTFAKNTSLIFLENPIFGVGTGDFPEAYSQRYSEKKFKTINKLTNPHNTYLFIAASLGIFGLLSLIYLFFVMIRLSKKDDIFSNELAIGFIILFVVINFSDSYLLGHFTSFLFVFFSSFLFKN